MEININEKNRFLIVQLLGELDHHSAADVRERVDKSFTRSTAKHIVFDLRGVGFMDSSGIGMLIGRHRALENAGGKVFAAGIGAELQRIFALSGLTKIIGCYNDTEEAMASEKGGKKNA